MHHREGPGQPQGNSTNGDEEGHEAKVTNESYSPQLKVQASNKTEEGNSTNVIIDKEGHNSKVTIESDSPHLKVRDSMETKDISERNSTNAFIDEEGHEAIVTNESDSPQLEVQDSMETEEGNSTNVIIDKEGHSAKVTFESNSPHLKVRDSMETKVRKCYKRHRWSKEEVSAVQCAFKKDILLNRLPGKADIETALKTYPCLSGRKWTNVKDFIRNRFGRAAGKKPGGMDK